MYIYIDTHALPHSLVLYSVLCIFDPFHLHFILFHTCLTPSALLIPPPTPSLSLPLSLSHTHTNTHLRSVWLSKPMWAGGLI